MPLRVDESMKPSHSKKRPRSHYREPGAEPETVTYCHLVDCPRDCIICNCVLLNNNDSKDKVDTQQVLYVPRHWWHYVESLDAVTVSVNTWIELVRELTPTSLPTQHTHTFCFL